MPFTKAATVYGLSATQGADADTVTPSISASLKVQPRDKVLEIGTGSGYFTALLASQSRHVISVDIDEDVQKRAEEKLKAHQITNVTYEAGDASLGWEKHKPYDVIAITGSMPILPEIFQRNLNVGGRLFVIVGDAPAMEAILITRIKDNEWTHDVLLKLTFLPLLMRLNQSDSFCSIILLNTKL